MKPEVRKRPHRVVVRLSDDEYDYFRYLVGITGLSQEAYLRKLISGKIPQSREIREHERDILSQLYAIGNNLNQIARKANSMNVIDVEKYANAVSNFDEIMKEFLEQR